MPGAPASPNVPKSETIHHTKSVINLSFMFYVTQPIKFTYQIKCIKQERLLVCYLTKIHSNTTASNES